MTTAAEHTVETQIGDLHIEASGELAEAFVDSVERPSHLAQCGECGTRVTYRPTASGAGFTVLKHSHEDQEVSIGISASGLPMCPDGHGEMEIADDQIPVADAFAHVAEQLEAGEAIQRSLPGIVPEFNWQGAYLELESKAVEVDADHRQWQEDAETAKESKKRWEKSAETFQRMGLEFRRRRREKSDGPADAENPGITESVNRCRFEQLNPGVPCPICTDAELLAASTVAPVSEEHGVEAKDLLERREIDVCVVELAAMGVIVPAETLGALPIDQLSELQAWSKDGMQNPERREELLTSLPKGLGRPCVVAGVVTSEAEPGDTFLVCERCDGRVASKATGSDEELPSWPAGTLYGTTCPGKEPKHRYPVKGKKKNTRKAKP